MAMFAGRITGIPVALLPQAVDDRRHQPQQHAAGALELHQRRPVAVEPVEHLGVDGIGRLDPLLVVGVAALGWKLLVLGPVELRERAGHDVPVLELRRIGERLEQPSSDDLETLFGACRPPGRFDAPDDVPQPVERLPSARAADLDVVGLGVGRAGGIRRRQADHQQAARGRLQAPRFGPLHVLADAAHAARVHRVMGELLLFHRSSSLCRSMAWSTAVSSRARTSGSSP